MSRMFQKMWHSWIPKKIFQRYWGFSWSHSLQRLFARWKKTYLASFASLCMLQKIYASYQIKLRASVSIPNKNCFLQSKCNRPCPVIQISRDAIRKGKFYFAMKRLTIFQANKRENWKIWSMKYYQLNFLHWFFRTFKSYEFVWQFYNGRIEFQSRISCDMQ